MKHIFRIRDFSTELAVGGLFFLALLILGYYTIILSSENWFRQTYQRTVCFEQVGGLLKGDHVLVRGIRMGTVTDLELTEQGVEVKVALAKDIVFREGYSIVIRPVSVLGGQYVKVDPGPADATPIPGHVKLQGDDFVNLMEEAAGMVRDVRDGVDNIRKQLDEGDTIERIVAFVDNLSRLSDDIVAGRGLIGRLISDEDFYLEVRDSLASVRSAGDNVADLATGAEAVLAGIRAGEGTVGRLFTDDSLYRDLQAVTAGLREGHGTFGKLLTEDEVYENVREFTAGLRNLTGYMQEGDSSFVSLFRDSGELFDNINNSFRALAEVGERLNKAEGSLGKLLHDDELYQETMEIVRGLNSAVQDFREQSAVATFGSFLFGAF